MTHTVAIVSNQQERLLVEKINSQTVSCIDAQHDPKIGKINIDIRHYNLKLLLLLTLQLWEQKLIICN